VRIAYLDCFSGISGDMTLGALIDAGVSQQAIFDAVQSLRLPHCKLSTEEVYRGAFRATHVKIDTRPEHHHRHLSDILELIEAGELTTSQKTLASNIFEHLAKAEAKVHGASIEDVHFHEVGAVDSIADIVGSAVGWDLLHVDQIISSHVPTGQGSVHIAHGTVSIPAPGTAELLIGVPLRDIAIQAELTTPTGAAILTSITDSFGPMPKMTIESIGYGAGSKELTEQPNVLRLFLGHDHSPPETDEVWLLETNLDDISGEWIGYCTERLQESGALDVFTTSIQMKKGRPAVQLSVICKLEHVELLEQIIFQETGSLGIRRWPSHRHKLERRAHQVTTRFGSVEGKIGISSSSPPSFSPEYESCKKLAQEHHVALREIYHAALNSFDPSNITS